MMFRKITGIFTPRPWKHEVPAGWLLAAAGTVMAFSAASFRTAALFNLPLLLHNAAIQCTIFAGSIAALAVLYFAPPATGDIAGKLSRLRPSLKETVILPGGLLLIYAGNGLVIMPLWDLVLRHAALDPVRIQPILQLIPEAGTMEFAALLLTVGILTPAAEELFFRRLLYGLLLPAGGCAAALLTTAAVFAAAHGFLYGAPALFWMGIIFQLTYLKSGNLLYPVMMHSAVNIITLTAVRVGVGL